MKEIELVSDLIAGIREVCSYDGAAKTGVITMHLRGSPKPIALGLVNIADLEELVAFYGSDTIAEWGPVHVFTDENGLIRLGPPDELDATRH